MGTETTFTINNVEVTYIERQFGGSTAPHDHFEFRSEFMGETGYQSHFEPSESVIAQGGPVKAAEDLISFFWQAPDQQMALF